MDEICLGSRTLQPHRQLLVNGRREPLGKRALDILSVLAKAHGGIVTKDELLATVWPGVIVEENALQVHIVALRKALGPEADRLRTIRGVGYQLDVDVAAGTNVTESGAETPSVPPAPVTDRASPPSDLGAAWAKVRSYRRVLTLIGMLVVLWAAWSLFGVELGLRSHERIPVVVRSLAASGAGDPAEVALANGITDELIDRLRRIPELRVATVTTSGEVKQASFSSAYVVDGSLRRSGDQLRVLMRLSDSNGEILWSQTFNRKLVDLLDMQQRVAASIADALSVSFDVGGSSTAYGGTDSPEAYAAFLEARANGGNPDTSVAERLLERALAIDPNYIQALALQSYTYNAQANITSGITRQQALALLAKADESSKRALAANADLWVGHAARGVYFMMRKDLPAAERTFRRVVELDQGNEPGLRSSVATYESFLGRSNKSLELLDSGAMIDPIVRFDRGRVRLLMVLGRYQEAIDLAEKIAADDPAVLRNLSGPVFWSYLAMGREAEAIHFSEQYFPAWANGLRGSRADKALSTMSLAQLRQWADRRFGQGAPVLVANGALFAGYDGQPLLAVKLMRVALEMPAGTPVTMLWEPAMADARKTNEFEQLVTDIGLVQIWRESGDWGDYCRPVSATEISCH